MLVLPLVEKDISLILILGLARLVNLIVKVALITTIAWLARQDLLQLTEIALLNLNAKILNIVIIRAVFLVVRSELSQIMECV